MGLKKLNDNFYLYPGSPSTGFMLTEKGAVLIDPGHGRGRHKDLLREARKLGVSVIAQLATHAHADHVAVAGRIDAPLYLHSFEFSLAESPLAREVLTFGSKAPEGFLAYAFPEGVRVHGIFEWGDELFGLEALRLDGHSPGMTGFKDEANGVIYAGDSFFGERVLQAVGLPYLIDVGAFLESLKTLEGLASSGMTIIPSHGPIVSEEGALELLSLNGERIAKAIELVLSFLERPLSVDELAFRLMEAFGSEPTPKKLALNLVPTRAIVAELHNRGDVEAVIDRGLKWVVRKG